MSGETGTTADPTEIFEEHRGLLTGVAYRMLGRVVDAEDIVQEAWLRWAGADTANVLEPRAYLVRITTRLAVDRLRSAQTRRETYVGPWLPEPVLTGAGPGGGRPGFGPLPASDVALDVELAESVSLALLVVLESLSPLERAVFVLREAFGFRYAEIGEVLERDEAAVRQLAGRARRHVAEGRPRYEVDRAEQRRLTEEFMAAATRGDLDGLLAVLSDDVRLVSDGGGKVKAPVRVMQSADKVGRFLAAISEKGAAGAEFSLREVNGGLAIVVTTGGLPTAVFATDVFEGRITTLYLMANPEKLTGMR